MEVKSAKFVSSSEKISQCPTTGLPEFAFIGRSNVGKSSLINSITNVKKLCKTSATPGKTRLINHFLINEDCYFVDLPGYGYAKVSKDQRKKLELMISSYILNRKELRKLFILLDSRHKPMEIDLVFIENIIDSNVPFALVLTKCDKISATLRNKHIKLFREKVNELSHGISNCEIIASSSQTKEGRLELLSLID
ncbi:MAG: ribosome biogenesis GTP-binding protein YihA/YsxC [Bacteroidales bacterium]|nr:ribosome biogenesis GTP-binding protein YihA/YsxC [Bacteroidales bacterium]